jgi:PadR family transcriptional regulator
MFYILSDMPRTSLRELDFMVLLSVMNLGDDAYGAEIRRDVSTRLGRDYSVGAIYATLQRLEDKAFLKSGESEPLPIRGGRSRRYFRPTPAGKAAMKLAITARRRLWKSLGVAS